jgi:cell cycle related kinase
MSSLPDSNKIHFPTFPKKSIEEICPDVSATTLDLVRRFLVYNGKHRIAVSDALKHDYFQVAPFPADVSVNPLCMEWASTD